MITTEGVDLPEGTIADFHDSYKYLGIPQANIKATMKRKSATTKCL